MKQISATALEAVLAQQTGELFLTVVKITHPDIGTPLRYVNDHVALNRAGEVYNPAAFEFRLPNDREDNVPTGEILLDNVDRQIIQAVRPLKAAPEIEVNIVLRSQPETVEIGPLEFKLRRFDYNAQIIRGRLAYDEDFLTSGVPKYTFSPRLAPGLF